MEIAPGVHSIPVATSGFMGVYAPNVYLVVGGEAALIDSGHYDREAISSIEAGIYSGHSPSP